MGVIAKGIPRGCQGLFTPVSLGYPLSVFNENSALNSRGACYTCDSPTKKDGIGMSENSFLSILLPNVRLQSHQELWSGFEIVDVENNSCNTLQLDDFGPQPQLSVRKARENAST